MMDRIIFNSSAGYSNGPIWAPLYWVYVICIGQTEHLLLSVGVYSWSKGASSG